MLEWLQLEVPGRFGTFYDVILNGGGACLGWLAGRLAVKYLPETATR